MSTYATILLIMFLPTFLLSFLARTKFVPKFMSRASNLLIPIIAFVLWDIAFTQIGVWQFAHKHVHESRLMGLPLEEILFFPVVAFSMLFVYELLRQRLKGQLNFLTQRRVFYLSVLFFAIGILTHERLYTSVVLLAASGVVFWAGYTQIKIVSSKAFVLTLLVSFVPFMIFNGLLTSIPVVTYDSIYNLNFRMGSIPVEDFVYSLTFLIWIMTAYENQ